MQREDYIWCHFDVCQKMDPAAFCGFKANFLGAPENPRSDLPNAKTSMKNDGKPPSATSVTQGILNFLIDNIKMVKHNFV